MRVAVVGHVEWVEFARVDHVPPPGGIAHADPILELPAGGGGVAAVQLAKLAGGATLLTALGGDELGRRSADGLRALGLVVDSVRRATRQRRALTLIDDDGERTITTLGEKLAPRNDDSLDWSVLDAADAVFFVSGDAGALRRARGARLLVATSRVMDVIAEAGVVLDALVGSGRDPLERYEPGSVDPAPRAVVVTRGSAGGSYSAAGGEAGTWAAVPPPGPLADTYGCGDSFAAGFIFGLATGSSLGDAVALGARAGAACATGRGPYEGQLRTDDL
jgi:ribokinase